MIEEERLDPEAILKAIQAAESKRKKGRLKIFLGMAAGVGKTYEMLEAAQKKVQEGVNVVVGIVETHNRPETERLLEPLKKIPEKILFYREKPFKELDIEKVILTKPQIVLVDELAHSNIPGSKHLKRWQDVMDILEAGIDVYTTLNIQHIESYKDIVEGITAIKIWETVPDLLIEKATDITLVDITPAELLQRLKEGKVYTGDLSAVALENFFQEDRLTALREISLRFTAEVVDQELHEMVTAIRKGKGWKARERLLVAINHQPYAQQLIRTARRLSFALHAPWIAVYVDDGETLNEEEAAMLSKNLSLVRELGGEVVTTQDTEVASGIQRVAEQRNITQIIIGRSARSKISSFFKRSHLENLTKISSGIDVHIIRQSALFPHKKKKIKKKELSRRLLSYFHILFWIAALSILGAFIAPYVGYRVVGSIFLIAVLIFSLFFKRGPTFLSALLFAVIWVFYFIPPMETFRISSHEDAGFFLLFFLAAVITGVLTNQVRKRQELLRKKEQSTQAIYEIVREISSAPTSQQLFKAIKEKIGSILQGTCEILVQKINGNKELDLQNTSILREEKEKAVARWVFENGKEAGWSTFTLPSVKNLYIPLKGFKEVVGVLAFRPRVDKPLLPEESNFLYTVVQQLANFLERTFSEERERKNAFLQQIDQIYGQVLQTISDELSRPLKDIQGVISACKNEKILIENSKLSNSLHKIESTSDSLMQIAENATDMAKLSKGVFSFEKSTHQVKALISVCVEKIQNSLKNRNLKISIQENLPPVLFDFSLMTILLHHLLMNAVEYSPSDSTIEIEAEIFDGTFVLSVSDEGKGIPEDRMERVFEKFYRLRGTMSTGLGLGLSIVKSIAEIHHGWIKVQNRETGGSKFSLILPL